MNKKFSYFFSIFCLASIFSLFPLRNIKAQVISGDLVGTVLDKTGAAVFGGFDRGCQRRNWSKVHGQS
jgi:hypothetical protein